MTLTAALIILESSGLIRLAVAQPEIEYLFRHALIQDAAYASLVKADRRQLHQAVGEALERLYLEDASRTIDGTERLAARELPATLAFHYARANAHAKALIFFTQAAEQARASFANDEAVAFFRAAIEQGSLANIELPHVWAAQSAQLHEQLGDVLELTGKLEEARAAYDGALKYAPQTDRVGQARLQRKIGSAWAVQIRHQAALEAYDLAERSLGAQPTEPAAAWWQEWIQLQLDRMRSHYWQGQWREVARLVEQTQPILEPYGTPALRFYFYDGLISVDERRNRYVISDDVLRHARAMLAAAQESGELRLIGEGYFQLGFCLLWHNDFDEAERHLHLAEEIMRRIGDTIWLTHTLTYRGILYRRRGQVDAARPYILQALAEARANRIAVAIARAEANLAWLAWRKSKLDEAERHGQAALELWSQSSFADPFRWTGYLPLTAVALHQRQTADAIGYARAMLEPTQHRLPEALAEPLTQAVQFSEQGQSELTRAALQQAIDVAEQMHYL